MEELIRITEHNGKQAVSARELHNFLESKREFATWMKDRIRKYGLIENQDYVSFDEIVKRETGSSVRIEYALSIDCAKELAMVEGNTKGKQARQYFIACEKKLKQVSQISQIDFSNPDTVLQLAQNWHDETMKRLEAERQISMLKPKAEYTEKVLTSIDVCTTTEIAKELGMSGQALNKLLYKLGIQYKHGGRWLLYSKYQNQGYTKTNTYLDDKHENVRTWHSTVWTEKGRMFIHEQVKDILKAIA